MNLYSNDKLHVICFIYEICSAMKYLHDRNIIHRDLKPENILITESYHVKICDFGISVLCDPTTQLTLTSAVGSLFYMAPELFKEKAKYDRKVDVFSFGTLLYFILTKGELPKVEPYFLHKTVFPPSINNLAREIISQCWSVLPENRPEFSDIINKVIKSDFKLIDEIESKIRDIQSHMKIYEHEYIHNRDKNICLLI